MTMSVGHAVARPRAVAPAAELSDGFERATRALAQLAVVVVSIDYDVASGVPVALPLALALAPLALGSLRRYALAPVIAGLGLAAIVAGWLLSSATGVDHLVNEVVRRQSLLLILSGIAVIMLLLWARTLLSIQQVVILYAVGLLAGTVIDGQLAWKFGLSLPVTLLVVEVLESSGRRRAAIAALAVLGLASAVADARSFLALCMLAALLGTWQLAAGRAGNRRRWFPTFVMATIAVIVYLLGSELLTTGYLGSKSQERSAAQVEAAGSVIVGGRPEWTATIELMKLRPAGYGAGVVPTYEDVYAAKAGLASVNIELQPGRYDYMFGNQFKLHSIIADLWSMTGWVGVGLAVAMMVALVRSISFSIATASARLAPTLAAVVALWFLLFGPLSSNWIEVCAAVGLMLIPVERYRTVAAE